MRAKSKIRLLTGFADISSSSACQLDESFLLVCGPPHLMQVGVHPIWLRTETYRLDKREVDCGTRDARPITPGKSLRTLAPTRRRDGADIRIRTGGMTQQ